jgi:hypothetical protein
VSVMCAQPLRCFGVLMENFLSSVSNGAGLSRDFTGDVLATAGGSMIVYFAVGIIAPAPFAPLIQVAASNITAAMLWKRARRDNV